MYRPAPRPLMLVFPTRALPFWRYTRTTQRASNPTERQVFRAIRKTILTANLMTGNGAVFDREQLSELGLEIKSMSLAGKAVLVWEQSLKSSVRFRSV